MQIRLALEEEEVVADWTALREAFEEAAEKIGLTISTIVHTDKEYL